MINLTDACGVTLHRTLRIPDDGQEHPLPPGLGSLPAYPTGEDEYVVAMHRMEAMWLGFSAPHHKPRALKVGVGGIDAISGAAFDPDRLHKQDYVVIPEQPWLDGVNAGDGFVRQFVAVALGEGKTVEAQLTGKEDTGGLDLVLFEPKAGRFPDAPPPQVFRCAAPMMAGSAMGLGAGGRMRQSIRPDDHGIGTWKKKPARRVRIDLVDAVAFEALTGITPPGPPTDAYTYTHAGGHWFDLDTPGDLAAAERLRGIRSIADLERWSDAPLPIPAHQVRKLLRLRDATMPV